MLGKTLKVFILCLVLLLLNSGLVGCGQKGDLYLPKEDKQSESEKE